MNAYKVALVPAVVVSLLAGYGLAPRSADVAELNKLKARDSQWQQVKAVDDQILILSGQAFTAAGDAIGAVGNFDVDTLNQKTAEINAMRPQMETKAEDRKSILSGLGY